MENMESIGALAFGGRPGFGSVTVESVPIDRSLIMDTCCWTDPSHWVNHPLATLLDPGWNPPPARCAFCGAELPYSRILGGDGDRFLGWHPLPDRCGCGAAQEWWDQYDARKARMEEERRSEEERREYEARWRARTKRLLKESGIPSRFRNRVFDTFAADTPAAKSAKETAMAWARDFDQALSTGHGLIFCGPNGTGKTHLAYAVALHLIERGHAGILCRPSWKMMMDFTSTYRIDAEATEREVFAQYENASLLVLDDLGKENKTGWAVTRLFAVLDARYESMRPTIITTNLSGEELERTLGRGDSGAARAIVSRLRDNTWMHRVALGGEDRRVGRRNSDAVRERV